LSVYQSRVNLPPEKVEQDTVFRPYTNLTKTSIESEEKMSGNGNEGRKNNQHP